MMDRIRQAFREQDWRDALTIGGVVASAGAMGSIVAAPGEPCGALALFALVGILVAMYSEARE